MYNKKKIILKDVKKMFYRKKYKKILIYLISSIIFTALLIILKFSDGVFPFWNNTVATIGFPLQKIGSFFVIKTKNIENFFYDIKNLYIENRMLKNEIQILKEKENKQIEIEIENRNLKKLLYFKNKVLLFKIRGANVIAINNNDGLESIIIDLGNKDGIKINMPVVSKDGLVGFISEVYRLSSRVQLLTSFNSFTDVVFQKENNRIFFIAQGIGNNSSKLIINNIPINLNINKGDKLVSAGIGGKYPKGLSIGEVEEISRNLTSFQKVYVKSAINITSLENVLVVLNYNSESE